MLAVKWLGTGASVQQVADDLGYGSASNFVTMFRKVLGTPPSGNLRPEQAYRTGRLAHLRCEAFAKVFNVPITDTQPCVFIEPGVIEQLLVMTAPAD